MISFNETKRLRAFDDEVLINYANAKTQYFEYCKIFMRLDHTNTHTHTNNDTITHTMLILGKGAILALEGRL